MDPRMEKQIEFILNLDLLKEVQRRSYLISGERLENSAEHSWHIAVMAMVLMEHANHSVDVFKTVSMLLVHDIVEIEAGDTYCYDDDDLAEQQAREEAAAEKLFSILPEDQRNRFMALWEEFDAAQTPEARFAGAMDRLMPLLQSYYSQGKAWKENGIHKDQVVKRNEPIAMGSEILWSHAVGLIDDAVQKGWLIP